MEINNFTSLDNVPTGLKIYIYAHRLNKMTGNQKIISLVSGYAFIFSYVLVVPSFLYNQFNVLPQAIRYANASQFLF